MGYQLFPKRAGLILSPQKEQDPPPKEEEPIKDVQVEEIKQEDKIEIFQKGLQDTQIEMDEKKLDDKKKVRGIKTQMRVVDNYILDVYKKVQDGEEEFVESLSTPLNKDPLEILLHL